MSKCHVQELTGLILALFEDVRQAYPTLGREIDRDIIRFRRSVERRGLHFLVVDLPAVGKHFDKCLANGEYIFDGHPLTKRTSAKVRVPRFLRALYLLIFDESGCLRDSYDVEAILFVRQLLYVGKKADLHCGPRAVNDEVVAFYETDVSLPSPESVWDSDSASHADFSVYKGFSRSRVYAERVRAGAPEDVPELLAALVCLDKVSLQVSSALGRYCYRDWRFRHGPGVVSTAPRYTNKYKWVQWSERLDAVFPIADCGYHNYASWAGNVDELTSGEPEAKLIDVPKTFTKPRLIASEPGEHQWCQQNVWQYFCKRVQNSWISNFVRFNDQTRNQELCKRGSVDGSLVTLDLSAASDRVTCHAVGQMFRGTTDLLLALQASRTRRIRQKLSTEVPEVIELRKFSTMGNACTFPVESLIFLSVAIAGCLASRRLQVTRENILTLSEEVAVFGDDIIVPNDCRELVVSLLEVLHFKVNTDKSFWNGKFRESCGVDAFEGVEVTPTYWRRPCTGNPESTVSACETRNSFQKKFFQNATRYLTSTIRMALPTVHVDSGVFGLTSFAKGSNDVKRRWNTALQMEEAFVPVVVTKVAKAPIEDDSALLQFFSEQPDPMFPWKSGYTQRPRLKIQTRWVPGYDIP